MTRRAWLGAALALPGIVRASALETAWAGAGFDPSAVRLLAEGPGQSFKRWNDAEDPVPPGSLLKPFAALAYGDSHGFDYPAASCDGQGCWLPGGHGAMGIEDALAQSCNVYFRTLARALTESGMAYTAIRFGLPAPPAGSAPDSYWGLGDGWRVPPDRILGAYRELHRRSAAPGVRAILEGLRRSAVRGTASGVGAPALAKTGTAPCVHRGSNGDGYACVLYPADKPRYTMLLQLHGRTGREAARAAGVALSALTVGRL